MMSSALDRVAIVLVEPQNPANVGAAARAMKNMGLRRLILVAPPSYDPHRARWMAPGCDDLIANTQIVKSLDEALDGIQFAYATTARHRALNQPVIEHRPMADAALAREGHSAILFGREDTGLTAAQVQRCGAVVRIPTPEHASLNLGQAVLLVAHALFEAARDSGLRATGRSVGGQHGIRETADLDRPEPLADLVQIERAAIAASDLLQQAGYAASVEKRLVMLRTALQRAHLTERELSAVRGMIAALNKRIG